MNYNIEEKEYVEFLLNNCYIYKEDDNIYYINSPNILRLIKINKLLNKNHEIKINVNKLKYKNIILVQCLFNKTFYINYHIFNDFFNVYYILLEFIVLRDINIILESIFNTTGYKTLFN